MNTRNVSLRERSRLLYAGLLRRRLPAFVFSGYRRWQGKVNHSGGGQGIGRLLRHRAIDVVIGHPLIQRLRVGDQALGHLRRDGLPALVMPDVSLRAADALSERGLGDTKPLPYDFDIAHASIVAPLSLKVNSAAILLAKKRPLLFADMEKNHRRANITPENMEEAARLTALWKQKTTLSQAAFGEEFKVGNQSAVGQFLRGKTPLSLKAAQKFATGLGVQIADFSPRLARVAQEAGAVAGGAPTWPFPDIDMGKLLALDARKLAQLEGAILETAHRLGIDIGATASGDEPQAGAEDIAKRLLDEQRAKKITAAHGGGTVRKSVGSH